MGDDKVREAHAERHGKVYSWDNPPEGAIPVKIIIADAMPKNTFRHIEKKQMIIICQNKKGVKLLSKVKRLGLKLKITLMQMEAGQFTILIQSVKNL